MERRKGEQAAGRAHGQESACSRTGTAGRARRSSTAATEHEPLRSCEWTRSGERGSADVQCGRYVACRNYRRRLREESDADTVQPEWHLPVGAGEIEFPGETN